MSPSESRATLGHNAHPIPHPPYCIAIGQKSSPARGTIFEVATCCNLDELRGHELRGHELRGHELRGHELPSYGAELPSYGATALCWELRGHGATGPQHFVGVPSYWELRGHSTLLVVCILQNLVDGA